MDNKMKDTNTEMKVEEESLARKPTPEEHKLMQLEQESANPPAKTLPVPDEIDLAVAKLAKSTSNKSYYQKNKARLLAQRKRRHEAKKEEENKKARASYAANPEPKKQQSRDRAKAKREQAKEQQLGGQNNGQVDTLSQLRHFELMVSMMDSNSRKSVKKAKEVDQRTRC